MPMLLLVFFSMNVLMRQIVMSNSLIWFDMFIQSKFSPKNWRYADYMEDIDWPEAKLSFFLKTVFITLFHQNGESRCQNI